MKKTLSGILAIAGLLLVSCTKTPISSGEQAKNESDLGDNVQPTQKGVLTASEWNDLNNWTFWNDLLAKKEYNKMPSYWGFYTANRVSVNAKDANGKVVVNMPVTLQMNGADVFTARTDNQGNVELWPTLFNNEACDKSQLKIKAGSVVIDQVKLFNEGVNQIELPSSQELNQIEVAFVMDATGSMSDELDYLKTELKDVINRVKQNNPTSEVRTSCMVYRDEDDEYLTRSSDFSNDASTTISFLDKQTAGGGGDYPEAVHTALTKAVKEFGWNLQAKTKVMFFIMDAPPHYDNAVLTSIQNAVTEAANKGIKLIPVAASGADKDTEFALRFMGIATNGTYVFITNDSGIGKNHMAASVGSAPVEYLNNLMVRLINKYSL